MDRTTRLIKWQRITIAALLVALLALGCAYIKEQNHTFSLNEDNRGVLQRNQSLTEEIDAYEQTIRHLDTRLKKYEVKYGRIEGPSDSGCFRIDWSSQMTL
ncbi:MAG: hypothetical protein V4671_14950, partial [Armatimonadota bacterium]